MMHDLSGSVVDLSLDFRANEVAQEMDEICRVCCLNQVLGRRPVLRCPKLTALTVLRSEVSLKEVN